ncbi:peptidyl-tRNA hydrolase [Massilia sp. Root351]|jgi:EpsD family peptidyl-prolyl cis-trans isomerase|uniref:EpsD family peptidyl-prolyl cis-trans isomerase n=1 Tax=Massilia sp. Root351 TaxID=1736522 RepID=UPI00070D34EB|nr:EpsD family peptidyl-prolyl cis-trans isomerase [Massilia sp. Root351]KQV78458.1 peptidyl-tRNA hydrolase [Massilia sp. Root351]
MKNASPSSRSVAAVMLLAALSLSACGEKAKKNGQALASVNGEEITMLQLNEEMQRSGVQAAQQETARKQLLEGLIDRQLLQNEAAKDKLERDPQVMQAIERAKAMIVAQAYMQKRIGSQARPGKAEVEQYYAQHPEFFANRKQFDMRQLVLATKDVSEPLKAQLDSAKSLEDAAAWLDQHQVKYVRAGLTRTSTDLPPELGARLASMPKGQLFIIREGERSMLIQIAEIKESPLSLDAATSQIEQFLFNKKNKEAAEAEIKRLRSTAKIEYFNKPADGAPGATGAPASPAAATAAAPAVAPAAAPASAAAPVPPAQAAASQSVADDAAARGVAGLK